MPVGIHWGGKKIESRALESHGCELLRSLVRPIVFASLLGALFPLSAFAGDQTVIVSSADPEMNAAITKARAALPGFWQKVADHPANENNFSVKLAISEGQITEHIWCGPVKIEGEGYACAIANEPEDVTTVAYGERMKVDPAIVSDWMYMRDGKIVGGETIRVMIPRMSSDEAAQVKDMLADP